MPDCLIWLFPQPGQVLTVFGHILTQVCHISYKTWKFRMVFLLHLSEFHSTAFIKSAVYLINKVLCGSVSFLKMEFKHVWRKSPSPIKSTCSALTLFSLWPDHKYIPLAGTVLWSVASSPSYLDKTRKLSREITQLLSLCLDNLDKYSFVNDSFPVSGTEVFTKDFRLPSKVQAIK